MTHQRLSYARPHAAIEMVTAAPNDGYLKRSL